MNSSTPYDLKRIFASGRPVMSVGARLGKGKLFRAENLHSAATVLSDRHLHSQFSEIEIVGLNGGPSLFLSTAYQASNPHTIVGYHDQSGVAILLSVRDAMKGHTGLMGLTQAGKTLTMSLVAYQLIRLGYFCALIGMKAWDASPVGYIRAACDSKTRRDKVGNPIPTRFVYFTLQANTKTGALNPMVQVRLKLPRWAEVTNFRQCLAAGENRNNPYKRFYDAAEQAALLKVSDWGSSCAHLSRNFAKVKMTTFERRSTAGLQNELDQMAAIEQSNLPADHFASIDLAQLLTDNGAIFYDACNLDTGSVGTSSAAYFCQTLIFLKRRLKPNRNDIIFIFIDEAQKFILSLLAGMIEQLAGFGIYLVIAYHSREQLGEYAESISMTQVLFVFSAVPGGQTDRNLQNLFGTTKELVPSYLSGESGSQSDGESVGPSGVSVSTGTSAGRVSSLSLTEHETPVWNPNDTLDLNYALDKFILYVSPGRQLSQFGPKAIVCRRGGLALDFDTVNALSDDTLLNTPNTYMPGAAPSEAPVQALPDHLADKRLRWQEILQRKANEIRRSMSFL